ncbi:MAG: hypothetical protein ABFQ95_01340 [Pseudomonadota bacterium]
MKIWKKELIFRDCSYSFTGFCRRVGILSGLIVVLILSTSESSYAVDKFYIDLEKAALKGGIDAVCGKGKYFRKRSGAICKRHDAGELAAFLCGEYRGFLKSDCGRKLMGHLGSKGLTDAKKNIIKNLKSKEGFGNLKWLACRSKAWQKLPALEDPDVQSACPTPATSEITRQKLKQATQKNLVYIQALKKVLKEPKPHSAAGKVTIGGADTGVPAIKIPEVKTETLKQDLLKTAEKLSQGLHKFRQTLDSPAAPPQEQSVPELLKFIDDLEVAEEEEQLRKEMEEIRQELTRMGAIIKQK